MLKITQPQGFLAKGDRLKRKETKDRKNNRREFFPGHFSVTFFLFTSKKLDQYLHSNFFAGKESFGLKLTLRNKKVKKTYKIIFGILQTKMFNLLHRMDILRQFEDVIN